MLLELLLHYSLIIAMQLQVILTAALLHCMHNQCTCTKKVSLTDPDHAWEQGNTFSNAKKNEVKMKDL